jgi:hypothetical protein
VSVVSQNVTSRDTRTYVDGHRFFRPGTPGLTLRTTPFSLKGHHVTSKATVEITPRDTGQLARGAGGDDHCEAVDRRRGMGALKEHLRPSFYVEGHLKCGPERAAYVATRRGIYVEGHPSRYVGGHLKCHLKGGRLSGP